MYASGRLYTFQNVLWQYSLNEPIKVFQLQTVTYGIVPSAYHVIRCLCQLSIDESENFSKSVLDLISNNMYDDDALFGLDTVDEAIELAREFSNLLTAGSFLLRKWSASSSEFLSHIPENWLEINPSDSQNLFKEQKLLDIRWNSEYDSLSSWDFITPKKWAGKLLRTGPEFPGRIFVPVRPW